MEDESSSPVLVLEDSGTEGNAQAMEVEAVGAAPSDASEQQAQEDSTQQQTTRRSGRRGSGGTTYNEDRIYAQQLQAKMEEDARKIEEKRERAKKKAAGADKRKRSSKGKGDTDDEEGLGEAEGEGGEGGGGAAEDEMGRGRRRRGRPPKESQRASARAASKKFKVYKEEMELSETDEDEEIMDEDLTDDEDAPAARKPAAKAARTAKAGGRKSVGADEEEDEEMDDSDEDVYIIGEDDDAPQPNPNIIGRRTLTAAQWLEIADSMNTRHVTRGSLWHQPPEYYDQPPEKYIEKYLVRWQGYSYLHVSWETAKDLIDEVGVVAQAAIKRFQKGGVQDIISPYDLDDYFPADYTVIDRVIDIKVNEENEEDTLYLIKWCNLGYAESTWEKVQDLKNQDLARKVEEYRKRQVKPPVYRQKPLAHLSPVFSNANPPALQGDGALRPYQWEAVRWMTHNYSIQRGSILADEMGLGKTVQSVAFMDCLMRFQKVKGPFLVVAPLSTLQQWYREINTWTTLNGIVYHGTSDDRKMLRKFEFHWPDQEVTGGKKRRKSKPKAPPKGGNSGDIIPSDMKFQVMLTTPANLHCDDKHHIFDIQWEVLILDEAHKLKREDALLVMTIQHAIKRRITICLTGTPLQNNVEEFFTLLNVCNKEVFADKAVFLGKYGELKSEEQVKALHGEMGPYLLRREKDVVEQNLPPKKEVILQVPLTDVQKKYYRLLYEKNVRWLAARGNSQQPQLLNLQMELRKMCNHPFLVGGVEEDIKKVSAEQGITFANEGDFLVEPSTKLKLLDKLLPKLKKEGKRILIFSHFKIMLNILEDYLNSRLYTYARIDGSIKGEQRQAALDRFTKPGSDVFIMLLTTKAGGEGINLMAADTVILYDSDWNPQHEIQAQARCHRIGQTRPVTVYRLLTRKTYEAEMFERASKRLALHHAVLAKGDSKEKEKAMKLNKEDLEIMLKQGAYEHFIEDEKAASGENATTFADQDIEEILAHSKVVEHKETQTAEEKDLKDKFGVARFRLANGDDLDPKDPDFWLKLTGVDPVKQAALEAEAERAKPRAARKRVANYTERELWGDHAYGSDDEEKYEEVPTRDEEYEDSGASDSEMVVENDDDSTGKPARGRGGAGRKRKAAGTAAQAGDRGNGGNATAAAAVAYQVPMVTGVTVEKLARIWEAMMRKGYHDPPQLDDLLGTPAEPRLREICHELIAILLKSLSYWDPHHPTGKLTRANAVKYCANILEAYSVPRDALTTLAREWNEMDLKQQQEKYEIDRREVILAAAVQAGDAHRVKTAVLELAAYRAAQRKLPPVLTPDLLKPEEMVLLKRAQAAIDLQQGRVTQAQQAAAAVAAGASQAQAQAAPTAPAPMEVSTPAPAQPAPVVQQAVAATGGGASAMDTAPAPTPAPAPAPATPQPVPTPLASIVAQLPPPIPQSNIPTWIIAEATAKQEKQRTKKPRQQPPQPQAPVPGTAQQPAGPGVGQVSPGAVQPGVTPVKAEAPTAVPASAARPVAAQQGAAQPQKAAVGDGKPAVAPAPGADGAAPAPQLRTPAQPRARVRPDDLLSVARWLITLHRVPVDFPQTRTIVSYIFGPTCNAQSDVLKGLEARRLLDEYIQGFTLAVGAAPGSAPQLIKVITSRSDFCKYPADYWDAAMSEVFLRALTQIGTILTPQKYDYVRAVFKQRYTWAEHRFPEVERMTAYLNALNTLYRKIKKGQVRLSADVTYPGAPEPIRGTPNPGPQTSTPSPRPPNTGVVSPATTTAAPATATAAPVVKPQPQPAPQQQQQAAPTVASATSVVSQGGTTTTLTAGGAVSGVVPGFSPETSQVLATLAQQVVQARPLGGGAVAAPRSAAPSPAPVTTAAPTTTTTATSSSAAPSTAAPALQGATSSPVALAGAAPVNMTAEQMRSIQKFLSGTGSLQAMMQQAATTAPASASTGAAPDAAPVPAQPVAAAPSASSGGGGASVPSEGLYKELPASFLHTAASGLQLGAGPAGTQVLFRPSTSSTSSTTNAAAPGSGMAKLPVPYQPVDAFPAGTPMALALGMAASGQQQQQQPATSSTATQSSPSMGAAATTDTTGASAPSPAPTQQGDGGAKDAASEPTGIAKLTKPLVMP